MSTFIQFINRKRELEFLKEQMKRRAFVVIYGRRRVGKSELIKHFIKDKKAIYLLATQEVEKEVVASFSKDIAEYFKDAAIKANPFTQFSQIMEYLKDKTNIMLIIDEFPYLVDANKAVPSIIQKYWDDYFRQKDVKIVLCGSSIGSMETEVMGRKSPLYGRRTGQWKVDPLKFADFIKFFPHADFERLVEFYSTTGGIPLYILEFDGAKSTYDNAKTKIATRGAILYQEAEILMKEELREPKTYLSLLKEMAFGKNTLNELANALGAERTALVRYIDILMELDLVEAEKPITTKTKGKITRYVLKDNYFKFWFRFIYPFIKELDSFMFDSFENFFKQNFNAYAGRQFEYVCREALQIKNPLKSAKIGRWWGAYRDNNERKTAEIDIVEINEAMKEILFAECKWQSKVDAKQVLEALRKKAALVDWNKANRKEHYCIFSKNFKEKKKLGENVFLYDLDDIEKIFHKGG